MVKKIAAYTLTAIVLVLTFIAVLGIWEVIDLEDVLSKILKSLVIVFISSVVVLFIFSVIIKETKEKN